MAPLRISQLANVTGVAAKTIRYYEQIGVLPRPSRTAAGYRQYDPQGVERLRFVRRARALGLSLRHLKTLTATLDGGRRSAMRPRLLALVREQLSAVRQQMTDLKILRQELERLAQRLVTSPRAKGADGCRCLDTAAGARDAIPPDVQDRIGHLHTRR